MDITVRLIARAPAGQESPGDTVIETLICEGNYRHADLRTVYEAILGHAKTPLGLEFSLNGKGEVNFFADQDQLTPAVVGDLRTAIQLAFGLIRGS
jgi:hypothetical protein